MTRPTFLRLIALAILPFSIAACTSDAPSPVESDPLLRGATPNANPAFLFRTGNIIRRTSYPAIAVMDVDSTDQTTIYTASATDAVLRSPVWYQGGSGSSSSPWKILFTEQASTASTASSTLKIMNVWVSNGAVSTGTPASVVSFASNSYMRILSQAHSSTAGEIVYATYDITQSSNSSRRAEIRVVSPNGGTSTTLYGETGSLFEDVNWSPDGSKIAFRVVTYGSNGSTTNSIRIIDRTAASDGTRTPTVVITGSDVLAYLRWSNTSTVNLLSYGRVFTENNNSRTQLYTVSPSASATPTAVTTSSGTNVYGGSGTWSADDSQIAFDDTYDEFVKILTRSNGSVQRIAYSKGPGQWRR